MSPLLALAAMLLLPAQQEPDWNAVQVKAEKVAGNVWMVTGRGGNIGVSAG